MGIIARQNDLHVLMLYPNMAPRSLILYIIPLALPVQYFLDLRLSTSIYKIKMTNELKRRLLISLMGYDKCILIKWMVYSM